MNEQVSSPTAATEAAGLDRGTGPGAELPADARIGPYRILRLLGEGGMGSVYLAEQQSPVFRQVALKLIREQLASPMARVWFEVERQALAQMQHPAIAQVFDAGSTDDGTLFLAMEWVDGIPITRYCREHQLDRAARLALFRRVCLGVQHAHQKGVIHRDLKPDNVLVRELDGVPQPKIIDFGIAIGDAAADDPASYERAGTAAYMSPEQASNTRRDIDTRSDVYSLGVMLFEVLTGFEAIEAGSQAFRSGMDLHTTLVSADGRTAEVAPSISSTLLASAVGLPGELRAVLRKALAPDREDRYESAAALAEDLDRFVGRRPIKAMPATRGYIVRKFISRHRLGLSAASLAGLALVVGIVMALAAEHRAEAAAMRAEQVSKFIGDILSGVDPDEAKGMDTKLLHKLLDRAGSRVEKELASQPEARRHIEHIIADSYASIGDYKTAASYADRMLRDIETRPMRDIDRAQAMIFATRSLNLDGQSGRALDIARRALKLSAGAAADDPRRLQVEEETAWYEWNQGKLEDAMQRFEAAYALRLKADPPDRGAIESDMRGIALVASDMGDYARAESMYTQLLQKLQAHYGDDNSKTLDAAGELAITLLRQKRFAEGEKLLRAWLPRATRHFGADHPARMAMFSNLGGAIRQQGRNEEARPYYEKNLAFSLAKYGADAVPTIFAEANLAYLLRDAGDLAFAEKHARVALAHMDAGLGTDNGYRGIFPDLLGTILVKQKRYVEAEKEFELAWKIYTTSSGYDATHPQAQEVVAHLIELYSAWNKPDQAAEWRARLVKKAAHDGA